MARSLPPRPNLDHLKHEAKRLLRALRGGDGPAIALLRHASRHAHATDAEIQASATLLDVQQALAREYGHPGWTDLKRLVASKTPVLQAFRPVLKIGSYAQAVEHYVAWLGFHLDWDWREAPGQPAIAAFSRDGVEFMVNEYPSTIGPAAIHLNVVNLDALVEEWNARRPGSARMSIEPPYEFPEVRITDPWGNVFAFEGKNDAIERARHRSVRPKMRAYVQAQLDEGRGFPTPDEVREVVGPPLGTAIEVLNEFPGYGEAFAARQADERRDR